MELLVRKENMLEAKEEAIDAGSKVSSYRSGRNPAARPWIPGTGQPISPSSGATFSSSTGYKLGPSGRVQIKNLPGSGPGRAHRGG
jgi:hypothetical protein